MLILSPTSRESLTLLGSVPQEKALGRARVGSAESTTFAAETKALGDLLGSEEQPQTSAA